MGETLEEYIARRAGGGGKGRALREAYSMWVEGKLRLVDPDPPRDYLEYLANPAYSLWFWTVLSLVALTTISIPLSSISQAFQYLRYLLGSLLVLYLPGAMLIEALYPVEEELSPLERLALGIGLSLALVPLVGLVLNYTPWGIRLNPILASLDTLTILLGAAASWRKYSEHARRIRLAM